MIAVEFQAEFGDEIAFENPMFANENIEQIDLDFSDSFLVGYPMCPADVYPSSGPDGTLNINELLGMLKDWGNVNSVHDVNYDSSVDVYDLLIIIDSWGDCG